LQWQKTWKHWHTDEFARVVDEIIATGKEPRAYATYNLRDLPGSGQVGLLPAQ
jgi:hypothetical protein